MWLRKSRKEPVLSHISMKNLPESERPYERFQILGAEALSDAELLAIILKTGTKDYTALDLARDLLSECQGNLLNLYEIGYEQLLERRGIGPVKATQLKAIAELSKRIARTGRGYHLSMNCPSSIADYYMEELDTEIKVGKLIDTIEYDYPTFHLSMDCFWCEIVKGELVLKEHEAARWLTREQLGEVEWLPADVTLIEKVGDEMIQQP